MNWNKLKKAELVEVLENLTMMLPEGEIFDTLNQTGLPLYNEVEYEIKVKARYKIMADKPDIDTVTEFIDAAIHEEFTRISPLCHFWDDGAWAEDYELISVREA